MRVTTLHDTVTVHKWRAFYAPWLVALSVPVLRLLDAGVKVLSQTAWEQRERLLYQQRYGLAVRVEDETLVLPFLPGRTLASLLDDPAVPAAQRATAIGLAAEALSDLHRSGFTHGDAMAENVMVDTDAGVARWFDFETVHEPRRSQVWRQADDLRALLATCLLRAPPDQASATVRGVMMGCDAETARAVTAFFTSPWRRSLPFHLGQALMSFAQYRATAHLIHAVAASHALADTSSAKMRTSADT